jgi:hypothetical protein
MLGLVRMNYKGQVAFESLILLVMIISASIYIGGLYFQTQDTTNAYLITRTLMIEELNSLKQTYTIDYLELITGENNILNIGTTPNTLTNSDIDVNKIEEKIIQETGFDNISIQINTT